MDIGTVTKISDRGVLHSLIALPTSTSFPYPHALLSIFANRMEIPVKKTISNFVNCIHHSLWCYQVIQQEVYLLHFTCLALPCPESHGGNLRPSIKFIFLR